MSSVIPYGRQDINAADIATVLEVLQSDFLTQGPAIERFENAICQITGARYAVALSSATAGLHLACLALDVGVGDWVWTSPNTFVASANCARYCGANVDFIDIEPDTGNINLAVLTEKLALAAQNGCLPKLLIPVHFSGRSCEMQALDQLAKQYSFVVLEDAAHAIGASYQGTPVGACQYSRASVFSFHPVKIVTTGEGGVITTNDEALYQRLLRLRSHGISRDPQQMTRESDGAWYYQQLELGFNYRMTDIQAALGCSQLQRLSEFIARRRALVARYRTALAELPIQLPRADADNESAWHLFVVRVPAAKRKTIFDFLRSENIAVNVHYIPVYLQPYYQAFGFTTGYCMASEAYYQQAITLPLYPALTDAQQDQIIELIKSMI
ncbi:MULTISPECIES: UDP-4-amino-4,6-dideoxy-N-acetyl-beta-L-altrosamine transaminase [Deefgea]|uniref:UDP-4-amino-4, 6-dideoxy-N-acetyl-beta-L-altrosamine transaminase n=1 Tax=Deefgea chitinilytica TaxID=570276 RepID=A0ABS2C9R4_9NEIS|nr:MULTISPECIES: UDP-4-amino-4,6-dideoxy-N-acetyl-beta-L-altrosamine transaminase [Deefgea]MBM5570886.1 UDP-4-amino-4,6-dideoxy-N-acetyl-beta-L-altrosamine transaminase [Deefgea chitinilytica]MBM9888115.1 UDP-4-amino-4,6-dideoxy-N-acetyl-beta-L-altrosamine transaminase [Deefgea sp. CFH1-16]